MMNERKKNIYINWQPPEPRSGLIGQWDKFIGPGASQAEIWLQLVPAVLAGISIIFYANSKGLEWSIPQYIIAAIVALDMVGGAITNATNTAKRWYHREGQGFKQHFSFIVIHGGQIVLVAWFFYPDIWLQYFLILYGYLLATSLVILLVPLYLQRAVAILCYGGAILISSYVLIPIPGLEWFVPIFFLKLLVSHLLREAPFSPKQENE